MLNLGHSDASFDVVTDQQKAILFPLLKSELDGSESTVLDFGCGPGRFTQNLAELIGGRGVGVDITPELLELAPKSPNVFFQHINMGELPFTDASFDVVWACLVLGGIPNDKLNQNLSEIQRVLRPGGIFFYIENTSALSDTAYWFFRDELTYIDLASFFCKAKVLGRYEDFGQRITVFAGRKY